jgi:hypothetical protein
MIETHRARALLATLAVSAVLAGCAGVAPNYSPSIENVEALKKGGAGVSLKAGVIGTAPGMKGADSLAMRANSMSSPVGTHYGDYLAAALRQELELARLNNPQSDVEISGVLLENNIDAGGFRTAEGQMAARFLVKSGSQLRYDKVKRVTHQWESSFAAAVAIPMASNNYPVMVQKLVGSLVSDPDFIKAVRP